MAHRTRNSLQCEGECYKKYIHNLAYKYGFSFEKTNEVGDIDVIWKIIDNVKHPVVTSENTPRNTMWWTAWRKLAEEYVDDGFKVKNYKKQINKPI